MRCSHLNRALGDRYIGVFKLDDPKIYTAIVGVIAAWVTAAFAFFNMLNTKHAKTSEFRQQWIDKLRDETAELLSTSMLVSHLNKERAELIQNGSEKNKAEIKIKEKEILDSFQKIMRLRVTISLRINKNDKNDKNASLRNLNNEFLSWLNNVSCMADSQDFESCKKCAISAQKIASQILKKEWERVKTGELAFKLTVFLCVPFLIVGLTGIVYLVTKIT